MSVDFDPVSFPVYYREGLAADKPTPGPITVSSVLRVYYETDTKITRVWNGIKWTKISDLSSSGGSAQAVDLDFQFGGDLVDFDLGTQTWTDLFANQSFVVASSSAPIVVSVVGVVATSAGNVATRAVIDSGGTPVIVKLGGTGLSQGNAFSGSSAVNVGTLSAGSHTIKLQAYANTGALAYCRPQALPEVEHIRLQVLEG